MWTPWITAITIAINYEAPTLGLTLCRAFYMDYISAFTTLRITFILSILQVGTDDTAGKLMGWNINLVVTAASSEWIVSIKVTVCHCSCSWVNCSVSRLQRRRSSWPGSTTPKWTTKLLPRLGQLFFDMDWGGKEVYLSGSFNNWSKLPSRSCICVTCSHICLNPGILWFLNDPCGWIEEDVFIK